jgi:hypothetical protein
VLDAACGGLVVSTTSRFHATIARAPGDGAPPGARAPPLPAGAAVRLVIVSPQFHAVWAYAVGGGGGGYSDGGASAPLRLAALATAEGGAARSNP